jgi:hypothetical protein
MNRIMVTVWSRSKQSATGLCTDTLDYTALDRTARNFGRRRRRSSHQHKCRLAYTGLCCQYRYKYRRLRPPAMRRPQPRRLTRRRPRPLAYSQSRPRTRNTQHNLHSGPFARAWSLNTRAPDAVGATTIGILSISGVSTPNRQERIGIRIDSGYIVVPL